MTKLKQALLVLWERGYRVSAEGGVYRLDGEPVRVGVSPKGYSYVKTRCREKGLNHMAPVHKLAAMCKYGVEAALRAPLIRHLDDVKSNNSADNIALGTNRDNYMDRPRAQRIAMSLKAAAKTRTVSVEVVREIRVRKAAGESTCGIARSLGLRKGKVSNIVNGKYYSTVV